MITTDQIIDGILGREGEGQPPYLQPDDAGGRTSWGVAERSHPEAWHPGPPTREQARVIYFEQYVKPFDLITDDALRVALIDDGVLSGVQTAIKRLQHVLGVAINGVLGVQTLSALAWGHPTALLQRYVVERTIRLARQVQHDPEHKLIDLVGWVTRSLSFLPEIQ